MVDEAGQQYNLGTYVAKVKFDIPDSEKRKLDILTQRSGQMDHFYESFSRSGGAMAATIGAMGSLASSGSGVQSVIGAMGSLASAMVDIISLPFLPTMMTGITGMEGTLEKLMGGTGSIDDMMNTLASGDTWSPIADAIGKMWDDVTTKIWPPLQKILDNNVVPWLKEQAAMVGSILAQAIMDAITNGLASIGTSVASHFTGIPGVGGLGGGVLSGIGIPSLPSLGSLPGIIGIHMPSISSVVGWLV